MKKIYFILIIGMLILTACSPQKPTPDPIKQPIETALEKVSDYIVFEKDIHMKYKGSGNEYAAFETYVDYSKNPILQLRNSNGGTVSSIVYKVENGALKKVFSQGETYYRYDYTLSTNQNEVLIKEPIQIGTSWTLSDNAVRSITSVDKQVTTPSGTYKTVEITTKRADTVDKAYYSKGIGLVKTEFLANDGSYTITSELEKIDRGLPLKQDIRLFFPDSMGNKIVYIDRGILLSTNEDLKSIFQRELKIISQDMGFEKVLSTNTQVLGISLDDIKGIVTVDFSKHLITEMNAGTSYESLILQCITNTIGAYYGREKVMIMIEGTPYVSGHILLKSGEYFTVTDKNVVPYKKP